MIPSPQAQHERYVGLTCVLCGRAVSYSTENDFVCPAHDFVDAVCPNGDIVAGDGRGGPFKVIGKRMPIHA